MPIESLPPFVIITGAIAAMGAIQGAMHKWSTGKPKAVGQDSWDRLLAQRDERVKGEAKAAVRTAR
jgi:NADH dehydrogenase (ubiquinone) 1 alpha subcomplex subunit 1